MNHLLEQAAEIRLLLERGDLVSASDERAAAALGLASRLRVLGIWTEASSLASAVIAKTSDREMKLSCETILAECEIGTGKFHEAASRLERLEANLVELGPQVRDKVGPRLATKHSFALIRMNCVAEAEPKLLRAYSELLGRPDSVDLGWCACNLGNLELAKGNLSAARDRFIEAAVSATRVSSLELRGAAYRNLGLIYRHQCRWDLASDSLIEAERAWRELGHEPNCRLALHSLAIVHWKSGELEAASLFCSKQAVHSRESGVEELEVWALLLRANIQCHQGEYQESVLDLDLARFRNSAPDFSRPTLLASEFLGDVHLEQGQAAEALQHYDEVWPKAMALVPKGDIVAELRRRRAECYLLLGRTDDAYAAATEALAHCRELGDRYEEAATYRVIALSAAAVGKAEEAQGFFTQGFAYYEDIETPYEWGKLWLAYGDWLAGPNAGHFANRTSAREAYLAARDHFSNMGARAKLRESEARLSALDAASAPAPTLSPSLPIADEGFAKGPSSIIRRAPRKPSGSNTLDLRSEAAWRDWFLVTRSEPLLDLLDRAVKLAKSEVSILITGETGTGKELIGSGIHRFSRLAGSYVALNCAAVPKEMIESELFGHVRGAFSGAITERAGLVEMAAKGTLFLDEVGEMSEAMQAKMLRFLESGEYRRVGESSNRHVKARLIAATNVSREHLEKGESFRGDLYWRLGQSFLDVPSLRHRKGDVPLLLEHFLRLEASKMGKMSLTFGGAAMEVLQDYAWPGNIRELIGVVRRAVALAETSIGPEHLDLRPASEVAVTLTEELAAAERLKLAKAMRENRNSPTLAARALGIPRTTLVMKLKRYKMR